MLPVPRAVLIGLYFANKNKTFADYARGGGNQNLWAVSASMAAGYCSALTLIGNPSELYMHGSSFTLKMGVTIIGWPVSSFVLLPVFKQLDGISMFQYVEQRFNPLLRRLISLLFIGQMLFFSAIALYLPSLPLNAALGIPQTISIGLVGAICMLYSSFGGIKAVTWTNLYHTCLIVFTMLAILLLGAAQCGGLARLLADSYAGGRWSLGADYWRLDLTTRHTVYNTLLGYTIVRLFLHGTSQMQVQSALSLSTMRRSQASQLVSATIYFLVQCLASAIGLVLYVAYKDCDPFVSGAIRRQDELLVHYVSTQLAGPSGVPAIQGLFLAAIFGSTLTAISSFQSSTSAMVVEDFLRPLHWRLKRAQLSDQRAACAGKLVALLLGLACIMVTFEMDKISGLQQASTTLYGVIGAPILATFLLGTLTRRTTSWGMLCGLAAAISFGLWVFVCQIFHRPHPLEASLEVSIAGCPRDTFGHQSASELNLTVLTDGEMDDQIEVVPAPQVAESLVENLAAQLGSLGDELGDESLARWYAQLSELSYLWLPLFTLSITVVVAYLTSLLTGPLEHQVAEHLLAPCVQRDHHQQQQQQLRCQRQRRDGAKAQKVTSGRSLASGEKSDLSLGATAYRIELNSNNNNNNNNIDWSQDKSKQVK